MNDDQATAALLERLRSTPDRLRAIVAGTSDPDLTRAGAGGGWGPVEVFCHLRDIDDLFIERITRMLNEDDPFLQVVDETLWPIERDYASQDPRAALEEFAANRDELVGILAALTPREWERRGYHEESGEQTVRWYAAHAAEHDAMHEQQLCQLLAED